MRIDYIDQKRLVIYYSLILDDILEYDLEDLKTFIKVLIVNIRRKYHVDLKGYYNLHIYIDRVLILEFEKIDDYDDEIDLNICFVTKPIIFVKFKDYFLFSGNKYFYNDYYYISIDDIDYVKYIEFLDFAYGEEVSEVCCNGVEV